MQLGIDLHKLGYEFVLVAGRYHGKTEDSYLVSAGEVSRDKFQKIILKLVRKYGQESSVIKFADGDDAYFLKHTGMLRKLGSWKKIVIPKYL